MDDDDVPDGSAEMNSVETKSFLPMDNAIVKNALNVVPIRML